MGLNRNGFTLIELLVVVLIIGILAAVAVPQYQMAVAKSRFANLRTLTATLAKAAEVYRISNNRYPQSFDELDVDLPGGFTVQPATSNSVCATTQDNYCCITFEKEGAWAAAVSCGRQEDSFIAYHILYNDTNYCIANESDALALKLCHSLGPRASWSQVLTPAGHKSNHPFYSIP